jgi:valyl-tRNA synthetase
MIMLGLRFAGDVPFKTVFINGLVRDEKGEKMSKTKGNDVDPLEVIEKHGTDALRFTLVALAAPGTDPSLGEARLLGYKAFVNKLWNASRFALTLIEPGDDLTLPATSAAIEDRWIRSRLERVIADVDALLRKFELAEALRQARDFFWDEFADWYIELAKVRLRAGDRTPLPVLAHVLDATLRLLHPFMPFVTEAIWQRLTAVRPDPAGAPALIVAAYPRPGAAARDDEAERQLAAVQDFVRAIRNVRAEKRVDAGRWVETYIVGAEAVETARTLQGAIEVLARARPLHVVASPDDAPSEGAVTTVLDIGRVALPMAGLFDLAGERDRLRRQIAEADGEVERQAKKLANEQFRAKAPAAVIAKEEERLATARGRLEGLRASLAELG